MNKKNEKKMLLFLIIAIALSIIITVGATFAYFSMTLEGNNNVNLTSLKLELDIEEDKSLAKTNLIPSIEEYVDLATVNRVDSNKNFLKPTVDSSTGELTTAGTTCIDDNLMEICSVYTFTVLNKTVGNELPIVITLNPSVNTFENLYFKVLDSNKNEVIGATHLVDDRYELDELGNYKKDGSGNLIRKSGTESDPMSSYVLTNISQTIAAAIDENTPSKVTYSIVLWIMETHTNQTKEDSNKSFAGGITVTSGSYGNNGITGIVATFGTE